MSESLPGDGLSLPQRIWLHQRLLQAAGIGDSIFVSRFMQLLRTYALSVVSTCMTLFPPFYLISKWMDGVLVLSFALPVMFIAGLLGVRLSLQDAPK